MERKCGLENGFTLIELQSKRRAVDLARAVTLVMLLLIGLASQSGCRPHEEEKAGTAPAHGTNESGPAAAEAARSWLATNAIRLETVEAGHGFADLQPLKPIIGPARIVALGEATHGTREFFQLKHRMLEFLVTEMGFNLFAIEATMPESFDINDYVLTGQGDPGKALAGVYFWTWDTEEVRTMIEWMRSYNADPRHTRKVKFYGFDMQFAPRAAKVTLAYLRKVDPPQAEMAEKALTILADPYTDSAFDRLPQDRKTTAAKTIEAVPVGFRPAEAGLHPAEQPGGLGHCPPARPGAEPEHRNAQFKRRRTANSGSRDGGKRPVDDGARRTGRESRGLGA